MWRLLNGDWGMNKQVIKTCTIANIMTIRFRLIKNFSNIYSFAATIICNAMCSVNIGLYSFSLSHLYTLHGYFNNSLHTKKKSFFFFIWLVNIQILLICFILHFSSKKIITNHHRQNQVEETQDNIRMEQVIWFCFIPLFIIWSKAHQSLTHFL